MTGRRICIFGGTFDPVHNAHIHIAEAARDRFSLDEVLLVPAANPPHKEHATLTPFEDRFRMVEMACAGHAKLMASRLEDGEDFSYTVNTLERLREELNSEDRLYFLIGADAFDELETWHEWQRVVRLADFIVVQRPGEAYHIPTGARVHRLDGIELPVSSSTIRARLCSREPIPELTPDVRAYIETHKLYGT
jgi:nicotinate-nucleotide adenylyltransferase